MRTTEIIKLMPTQYRQTTNNPLNTGHYIPLLGTWTKADGYIKKQSLTYLSESLACPIIAVVNRRVGKEDVTLTITGKTSELVVDVEGNPILEEKAQGDYTIKRKKYIPTETEVSTTLTIPRYTRQWATFLLTGLGKMVYEINTVTDNVNYDTCRVEFYALASSGSRIIYWLGLHRITEILRDIVQGPWIAPTKCLRCGGTGIEPEFTVEPCKQCLGYKYDGYNATRYIQRMKGFDVGLAREVLDWDNMTDADHQLVKEFINKAWTQKWWVTPTKKEIKRLFAHFLQLATDDIQISERFHMQEPVWDLLLPRRASLASPFGRDIYENYEDLLTYIAESVTPAGVSVFVGFYDLGYFGDFDFDTSRMFHINFKSGAFETRYKLLSIPRWSFWNGWTNAIDNFERGTGVGLDAMWTINGDVSIDNVNDQNRHMAKFVNNCYIEHDVSGIPTGQVDFFIHPQETEMRFGLSDNPTETGFAGYVAYKPQATGFFDNWGTLIRPAMPNCDYHVRIDFVTDATGYGSTGQFGYIDQILINRIVQGTGFAFERNLGINPTLKIQNIGQGTGYMDAYGNSWNTVGYNIGDNYQRLYPKGFGLFNLTDGIFYATYNFKDEIDGTSGTDIDLIDSISADDSTYSVEVIATEDNHRKIIKFLATGDNGKFAKWTHNISSQVDGTIECWVKYIDNGVGVLDLQIGDEGGETVMILRFNLADNKFYVYHAGVNTNVVAAADTLHHIRVTWDCATDTYSVWLNGINIITDLAFYLSRTGVSINYFSLWLHLGGGVNSLEGYLDAFGESWDPNYNVGDNLKECLYHNNIRQDRFWKEP